MIPTPLLALSLFLQAAAADPTLPPATAHADHTLVGHGVQIYRCTANTTATPATFAWKFQSPDATLFDPTTRQPVGTHSAGPTWTWFDKSAITGKVLQQLPSPDPKSIPWLLLEATPSGSAGALSNIRFVRRADTQGGVAPSSGCDAESVGNTLRVPYEATYTFYSAN